MMPMGRQLGEPAKDHRDEGLRELQRLLDENEKRLEEIQVLARIGSWEWKLPEMSAIWSRELLRIFGRDPDGPPPTIDELVAAVHPDDRPGFQELVARVRQTRGPFQYSYRIVDAAGEVHYLQAHGRTVTDAEGNPTRSYGTTQDISELKRSEAQLEQAQRLEALGQLAGGVAHDFNNLLAVILNYTECLLEEVEDDGARAALREVERASMSAAELTRRLLLFGRREAPDLESVDLAAAVRDAETLLRRTIGEQVELGVEVADGLPPAMLGVGQAEQVLINLAVNARDAMPAGGRIAVTLGELDLDLSSAEPVPNLPPGAPHLVLAVADEGVGMSKEVVAQAFDPFFTTKPKDQGTGLGLATVFGIVNQAGGRVEIESEPDRGTTVRVYLPVAGERGGDGGDAEHSVPAPGAGRTILVVDNEEPVLTIVCRMLERNGYVARAAVDGATAEAILGADDAGVDLLLTDLRMPGMSGAELVRRVRAKRPEVRAIYMSGFAGDIGSLLGPEAGEATILEKPFTATQLLRAVGDALGQG